MTKFVLTSLLSFLTFISFGQCPNGITLSSQQEVNDFIIDYPSCTGYNNGLNIDGADIVDLSPLSQLTFLETLQIGNTSLTSLSGLEQMTFVYGVFITNNDQLVDISALENLETNVLSITITDNALLGECSILSVCELLVNGGSATFQNNALGCNSQNEVEIACQGAFNSISGTVLFDFDGNSCNTGDYPARNIHVEVSNGMEQAIAVTDSIGNYSTIFNWEGTVSTRLIPESYPSYFTANPASVETVFTGFGNEETVDFCLTTTEMIDDVKVTMIPLNFARPGFDSNYRLILENVGSTIASGTIVLTHDSTRNTYLAASSTPILVDTNQVTWEYTNLVPFEARDIYVEFNNEPPPTNESGDILVFEAEINLANDNAPDDNVYILEQEMVNSQDPNDKLVAQGTEIFESEVGDFLEYMVRFQNVGTASAINVRVDDVLSENLDITSFRLIDASHTYELEITNNNEFSFIFDNINLPPAASNPVASNGHIAFQIRTIPSLTVGDVIENQANIFFDFNAPIITNMVTTTVVDNLGIAERELASAIELFPNPVSDLLIVRASEGVVLQKMTLYATSGQQLLSTSEAFVATNSLKSGIYFLTIETNKGKVTKRMVKE